MDTKTATPSAGERIAELTDIMTKLDIATEIDTAIRDSQKELVEAIKLLESKANEARRNLTAKPSNKPACNIILLQMAQGKFSKAALAKAHSGQGEA